MRPQGWIDTASVVLEKSATGLYVSHHYPKRIERMVDDEMRRRLALIAPHARRALLIGKSIDLKQSETATFADTLNGLSAGIVSVDADGRIVHANVAGHDMLYANDFCAQSGAGSQPVICRSIRLCADFLRLRQRRRRDRTKTIALALTAHDGERYVAHVLPLTSGARRLRPALHRCRRRVCA